MSLNENTQSYIYSGLNKTSKIDSHNTFADRYGDDLSSVVQGYVDIDPPEVIFAGFEVTKLHRAKITITNYYSKPQKIEILPPTTSYFKIYADKKSQIGPGTSEEIWVQFTPNGYKDFRDCIRVVLSDGTIPIDIHAYPVMDKEARDRNKDIFSGEIGFGACPIGVPNSISERITCKIPLDFYFEFIPVERVDGRIMQCEEKQFRIRPLKGIIPGNGSVEIVITFTPTSTKSLVAEYRLMISEYDFEPIIVKVTGSGEFPKEKNLGEVANNRRTSIRKTKFKQQETMRVPSAERPNEAPTTILSHTKENLRPIREGSPHEREGLLLRLPSQMDGHSHDQKLTPEKLSPVKKASEQVDEVEVLGEKEMTDPLVKQWKEKQFLEKFNLIATRDKEKQIKYMESVGDKRLSEEEEMRINENRRNYGEETLDTYETEGVTRYELKLDEGMPTVGEVYPKYNPTYGKEKNDNKRKGKKAIRTLRNNLSKKILKKGVDNKLKQIKTFLDGAKTAAEVEKLVEKDWQKADYGVGKREFVIFHFQYSNNSILDLRLPFQIETSAASFSYHFELNQRIGFDDFTTIDPLPFSDIDVMGYTILDPPKIINYLPIEANRKDRKGAEEEYRISGPTGPVEKASETIDLVLPTPTALKKPPNLELHKFVCPHPMLKSFTHYCEITETDPEYALQPAKLDFQDSLDPTGEGEWETLYREYLTSGPGMEGVKAVAALPVDFTNYYTHKFNLAPDFGFEEKWEKLCPDLLDKAYDEDKFDNEYEEQKIDRHGLEMPDVDLLMEDVEFDEAKINDLREKNEGDIWDECEAMMNIVNKNLENEKKLWNATLTTKVYEVDKNIVGRDRMLNLL